MSEQTQNQETAQQLAEEENHIIAERRAKLAALREAGVAYPNDFVRTDLFGDIRAKYQDATAEELEELKPEVACSGRMMLKRIMARRDVRPRRHRRRQGHALPHEDRRTLHPCP